MSAFPFFSKVPYLRLFFWLAAVLAGIALARLPLLWAGALAGGTAVFLLTFIQPLFGLGAALLAGPLGALENIALGGGILDSGQLLLLLTFAAWAARGLRDGRLRIPYTPLNLPLALFISITLVTLLQAPSIFTGFTEVLKWVEIGLVLLLVVDCATTRPFPADGRTAVPWVLGMLLLAGLSQALIGIWQFGLRDTGPEHFLILDRFYRAYGTYEQPNPFGGFMNLTALLAAGALLGLVMAWQQNERPSPTWRGGLWLLFVGGCAAAAGLGLLFSWSRGAWLGFGAGTAVMVLFWPRRLRQGLLLAGGTAVIAAALLFAGVYSDRLPAEIIDRAVSSFSEDFRLGDVRGVDINDANYSVLERLAHWQAAVDMARDDIWLGVGFGNYEPAYADYALINWPDALGHAHNYYLNLLAETGVLGLLAYVGVWTAVFWQTIHLLGRLDWPRRGVALGLLAAWTALSVHHLVDKLYVNNIYIHLGVMFGLLALLMRSGADVETAPVRQSAVSPTDHRVIGKAG